MKWYQRFWQRLKRFSIPNLMLYISTGTFFVYLVTSLPIFPMPLELYLGFDRSAILAGEIWRLITFIFVPPYTNLFSLILMLYLYTFIGRMLEQTWGSASFTRYYLLGLIGTIIGGLFTGTATNEFLHLSLFFAFATLYPNTELRLFFFLPIKAKYLALADAVLYAIFLVQMIRIRYWGGVVSLLISLVNFFIFFGPDIFRNLRHRFRYRDLRRQFRNNSDQW